MLIAGEAFHSEQSKQFVDNSFDGSLTAFLAAFMNGKRLSPAAVTADTSDNGDTSSYDVEELWR